MQLVKQDRVFDGLANRFQSKIYDDPRGAIRLSILQDDLAPLIIQPEAGTQPLQILDAGGGLGHMSIWMAQQGHQVVLAEPSVEMLQRAESDIQRAGLEDSIHLVQSSVQEMADKGCGPFDLITFHAVLEWLAEPRAVLEQLLHCLKPGGWLSLMFFSEHSTVMRRLIAGDFEILRQGTVANHGRQGLAPISPLKPEEVKGWLQDMDMVLETWSGIRCFYDYMHHDVRKKADMDTILPLERHYSRIEPWRSLARYQHMLCWKK
ncbi:MAG: methyltransferase domain-containing protein [Gammaproteobacteria bacterium]|nr:methyltransferase domain-containing protein [Gammaproteobacteria bacterium]MBU1723564.1 methyltransferase domain-containing protein [Gammaproteobacteria bacterium]MBU2004122.1 methyltransferase domain-containing protein [Gammaproteobacteria bacterium]